MGIAIRALGIVGIMVMGSVSVMAADAPAMVTVEGIFQKKAELKDHTVQFTGKVVKATMGVMKKNFYHIQDGSGAAGTNDVPVTSLDTAAVGDMVTVTGSVAVDLDFGSGYAYPVLVEKATLTKAAAK